MKRRCYSPTFKITLSSFTYHLVLQILFQQIRFFQILFFSHTHGGFSLQSSDALFRRFHVWIDHVQPVKILRCRIQSHLFGNQVIASISCLNSQDIPLVGLAVGKILQSDQSDWVATSQEDVLMGWLLLRCSMTTSSARLSERWWYHTQGHSGTWWCKDKGAGKYFG